jgi:hypothetical protein
MIDDSTPGVTTAESHAAQGHMRRLQAEHEYTIHQVDDAEEMKDIIEKFDSRIHWLDWTLVETASAGSFTIAYCGAVIHDGEHWHSTAAINNDLSSVNCPDCCAIPEYNLKLLAQTDLGDGYNAKTLFLRRLLTLDEYVLLTNYVSARYGISRRDLTCTEDLPYREISR